MVGETLSRQALQQRCPSWVRWIAQDADGAWWGFEHEPNEGGYSWYENEVGRYLKLAMGAPNPGWRESIHRLEDSSRS
jgi:hypothetical protein